MIWNNVYANFKHQKTKLVFLSLMFSVFSQAAAQFTPGNLVVEQVGDGTTALTGAATTVKLLQFTTTGTSQTGTAFFGSTGTPTSSPYNLVESGNAMSSGYISLSVDKKFIVVPGYNAPNAQASITSSSAATYGRTIGKALPDGTIQANGTFTALSGQTYRSVVSNGLGYWLAGSVGSGASGVVYTSTDVTSGNGTVTPIFGNGASSGTTGNSRVAVIFNNTLFVSTSSTNFNGAGSNLGIYQIGSFNSLPTSATTATNIINTASGTGTTSVYGFSFSPDGLTCYIADDRASSSGGIQKWGYSGTFSTSTGWSGGTWSLAYTLGTGASNIGARGITVDFSGTNPIIYATTAEGSANRVIKITDTGSGSTATTLSTAGTNFIYRGVAFAPIPTVNLSVSANAGTEAGLTSITVTATASAPVASNQTVSLAVTGTGIAAGDYNLSNTTITILNGQTTGSVTFTVVDDALVEGTETATLTISSPSSGISLGTTTTQNIVITDNDFAPVSIVNGPNGSPDAVGPTNNNDDFSNKSSHLPTGTSPASTLNPQPIGFTNTVKNTGTAAANISLLPTAPANLSDLPNGTIVTLSNGTTSANYTYNGTAFGFTSGSGFVGGNPVSQTNPIRIDGLAANATANYGVEIDLPDGTPLSTDSNIERGFPVTVTAFIDANGNGSADDAVKNNTIDRVYTGFLQQLKKSRILQGTGAAVQGADGTLSTVPKQAAPGNIIEYVVQYKNISEAQSGIGNIILNAGTVVIIEDGTQNNWATENSGVIYTSHVLGSASGAGTIQYFSGNSATNLLGGEQTGTTAASDVTKYVNMLTGTIAPGVSGTVTFQRLVSQVAVGQAISNTANATYEDPNNPNSPINTTSNTVTVTILPNLNINDVSQAEVNSGTTNFTFTVSLSAPAGPGGVTFDIATADNTAQDDNPTSEDNDYVAKSLTGQTIPAGSSTYSFNVLVNGDATPEANETFFVNVTNITGANAGDTQGQGTIQNDDVTLIHDVQGSGASTPIPGATVTIKGIVVGDFENTATVTNLTGFYVQEEDADADADPATSEGIFVFKGNGNTTNSVAVGDLVTVTGTVAEFTSSANGNNSSLTQITSPTITINSAGNPLPTATSVQLPMTNVSDIERYEGMRINLSAASGNLAVTETFQLGRFGQIVLAATGSTNQTGTDARLDQYTQFNVPSVSGNAAYLADIAKRKIYLDDGRSIQNPDPIIFGRGGNPLSATNTLRGGDEVAVVTGILDERLEGYRIQTLTSPNFIATNVRPSTPPAVGGTLKVASFNVLNYFNGDGSGGGFPTSRGADNVAEFTRQRDKIIQAIIGTGADVLGLMELEDDGYGPTSAIQDLVNGLNAVAGAGTYAFVNPGDISDDEITVGIIYKPATIELVGSAAAIPFAYGTGSFTVVGRRSLAQTLRQKSNNAVFTLVVNHFKSKGSSSGGTGDADAGDGQGLSNGTRTRQAQDLGNWLATNPTGTSDPDYLIIGDLNAYAKEDPLTTLATAGYNNLNPITSYSYVFDGQVGSLDHALGTSSLAAQMTGAEKWHINADEPTVLDYNTEFKSAGQVSSLYNADPFRSTDHDAVLVGLNLTSLADLAITKTDGVTTAVPGGTVTYTITASNAGPNSVTGATVLDNLPTSLTATWTCVGAGGGTCTASGSGNINDVVNLPSGGSVTYTVSATISPSATGNLVNTATVTAPGGVTDSNPANNSATDTDTFSPQADLAITKTDGVTTAVPGGSVTYTITASNAGPSNAPGATVSDVFPSSLTATWTCVGAGGGTCTASGSGNINDVVNLPAGGSVTYTVSATISASATGTLSNTATVTAPAGVTDPTPGNNSATDTDTFTPQADLAITKTDGVTTAVPGGSVTYTITASNAGPSNAPGATVSDVFPSSLTATWTCVGAGGGTCTASGSGNISDMVNLPAGGSVTYTVSATISPSATGTLSNTATVSSSVSDPTPGNNSATDTDVLSPQANLSVTMTDSPDPVVAGDNLTYTITTANAGPSIATSVSFSNTLPTGTTFVSLSSPGGWSCSTPAVGATGTITCTRSSLGTGSDIFTLEVAVDPSLANATVLSNTVTLTSATTDPVPGNNSATATTTVTNICSEIGTLTASPNPVCINSTTTLTALNLVNMNVRGGYGIIFKYFNSPTSNPYEGGTTITTIANGSLSNGGTQAETSTSFAMTGTYYLYAILSPTPANVNCRPFATTTLTVLPIHTIALSSLSSTESQVVCINTPITAITYTLGGGATGASVTGLPTGVTYGVSGSTLTISGSPTVTVGSPFGYNITTTGNACTVATESGTITVVPQPVAPTINVKTPNVAGICTGTAVSATFNPGSGGVGCSDDYTVSIDGATPVAYTPGSTIGANATSSIVIQGRRANCSAGSGCNGTAYVTLASWNVYPQPVSPSLNARTPNIPTLCAGTNVSATFNAGSGGLGCSDDYVLIIDNGSPVAYTQGTLVGSTATTSIVILGRRANCSANSGCNGTAYVTLASWNVSPQPVGPTLLAQTPNLSAVCGGTNVSATFNAGSGGVGCSDDYVLIIDGGSPVAYTPGTPVGASATTSIVIQGRRANCTAQAGCNGTPYVTLASWSVSPQPVGPTLLAKTPNVAAICFGTAVSATFNAGSGGVGCSDDYTISIDGGTPVAYTPGTPVGASANSSIVIQGRRANCSAGSGCSGTSYVTLASWSVSPQPVGPSLLAKTPNGAAICFGTGVSATFNAGSGGVGCSDDYTISIDGGSPVAYTPGSTVGASANSSIVIQGRRANCSAESGCNGTSYVTLASWSVNPLPTASIAGTTQVCQNAPFPQVTFTGSNGTAPYTFTYKINGGADLTVTTTSGNSVSVNQTTANAGDFEYTLVSVKDASSTQCSQSQSGSATITVHALPVVSTPQTALCTGLSMTLSPTSGGTWQSSNPSMASVSNAGLVTGMAPGVVSFTFTQTSTGCSAATANVTIKPTPTSNLSASKYDVCPNTLVTLTPNCSIPTSSVNWNPGGPTVTPDAATIPYVYRARCVADGCVGNESSVEVRTHRILVDMKDLDVGPLPKAIVRAVKDNMEPTNLINAPAFPRRWTFIATGCDASEAAVFKLSGPVNFNTIDNAATYAMFANDAGGFYSIDHPNYGNGGSFPNGTYSLTIDLRSQDGVGGPFPKNRVATGALLATRTLQFTVVGPSHGSPQSIVGSRQGNDLFTVEGLGFAEVSPNPVSNTMRLKVTEAKGQNVSVSLVDASGRTMLQRSFVPDTNQHQEEFNVGDITNGMYFLNVNTENKNATLKVVKVE